jgi:hypothetical protein
MGTYHRSEVYFWLVIGLPLNRAYFLSNIGLLTTSKYVTNNHVYLISIICLSYFIRLEVGAPEWKNSKILIHIVELAQRTWPVASCSGFRGLWIESSCRHTPSTHRIAVVALHSTGCSHLSLFSCLVVDKLLLVLLLSWCKVPPMGTLTCRDRPAWVVRLGLLPWKIADKLDYYDSFVSFAGTA